MPHIPIKKLCIGVVAAVVVAAGAANAEFTSLDPITKTFNVEGQTTTLTVHPKFAVSGADGSIKVDLNAIVDSTDLQDDLTALMNRRWKYDECGERFSTHGATILPSGDGWLHVGVTAQAQLWKCIKTKVPKQYMEMKDFGFFKTKIPVIRWEMETGKTKLVSQSVRVEAQVRPVLKGDNIVAEVRVTKAMPSGLAKHLVQAFGLHGKIKDLVQQKIGEQLRGKQFRLPEEIRAYNVVISAANFVDLGGGRLGLRVSATGTISQEQLSVLLNDQISKVN